MLAWSDPRSPVPWPVIREWREIDSNEGRTGGHSLLVNWRAVSCCFSVRWGRQSLREGYMRSIVLLLFLLISAWTSIVHAGANPIFGIRIGRVPSCFGKADTPPPAREVEESLATLRHLVDARKFADREYEEIIRKMAASGEGVVVPVVQMGLERSFDFFFAFMEAPGVASKQQRYLHAANQIISMVRNRKEIPHLKQLAFGSCGFEHSALHALMALEMDFTREELDALLKRPLDAQTLKTLLLQNQGNLDREEYVGFLLETVRLQLSPKTWGNLESGGNLHYLEEEEKKLLLLIIRELGKAQNPVAEEYLARLHRSYVRELELKRKIAGSPKELSWYSETGQRRVLANREFLGTLVSAIEHAAPGLRSKGLSQ